MSDLQLSANPGLDLAEALEDEEHKQGRPPFGQDFHHCRRCRRAVIDAAWCRQEQRERDCPGHVWDHHIKRTGQHAQENERTCELCGRCEVGGYGWEHRPFPLF